MNSLNSLKNALSFQNPLVCDTIHECVKIIANLTMQIGALLAVLFIIWSGFLFVTARGNEEQIKKAKGVFYWTIIGTMVLLGSYVFATAVVELIQSL